MDDGGVSDDLVVVNCTEAVDKQSDELEILKEITTNAKKKRQGKKRKLMDDGGVSDDLMVVNSTEMVDNHFDELEILKEVPVNAKKRRQGKNLQNESERVDKQSNELEILKEIPANAKKKRKSTFMDDGDVSDDLVVVNSTETVDKQSNELEILKGIPSNAKNKRQGKKRKSALMDDGVFYDFMAVNSTEMIDKQSDELEILREIPANAKKKRQGKKLHYESERAGQMLRRNNKRSRDVPSSSSIGLTTPPRLMQCGNRNWITAHERRNKMMLVDEGSRPCNRRWEDMDHEILIHIFKRYPWHVWCSRCMFICKSWLSAFLDYLFPPGQVLDLRLLDGTKFSISPYHLIRFYQCLMLNIDRRSPNSYTEIVLSEYILRSAAYKHIARRLPWLKSFVCPEKMIPLFDRDGLYIMTEEDYKPCGNRHGDLIRRINFHYRDIQHFGDIAYWMGPFMQNLERIRCHIAMVTPFAGFCKLVRSLTLFGRIFKYSVSDPLAGMIAQGFPLLEHLSISGYMLYVNGLSMILDGHKNLHSLDVQHTVCKADPLAPFPLESPWPEEISKRMASVKTVLTCPWKSCAWCRNYYQPYY